MDKISFVLPLKVNSHQFGSDLDRVKKVLLPSMVRYFNLSDIGQFLIITPTAERGEVFEELKEFIEKLQITIISEDDVLVSISGWKRHVNIHKSLDYFKKIDKKVNQGRLFKYFKLNNNWYGLSGWLRQQILKLFSAKLIKNEWYMTLDSDLCLTRPASFETLFPDGKAISTQEGIGGEHFQWWAGSAEVLGIKLRLQKGRDQALCVTPEILSTRIVIHLIDYLIAKSKEKKYFTIFEYLTINQRWTEYTLYWLFLLEFFHKEDFYTGRQDVSTLHRAYSVWSRGDVTDAQTLQHRINSAFSDLSALFLVVQSNCIPLSEYFEIIQECLSNRAERDL